ncbi:succinyl-CoA synthetase beta chain [Candidatus Blochmanniella floridana]|uniref:Succinate--CoA ligase [ADP-forming] subunit beta n=1 Tax=Blochmanniella floridana TaxID=203907 RepID=Q7VR89_BLOFL|nr:succinyl-CoA synthetase beta chain [Candidatus Blochmannia floridanus]
MNLYEYQAKQLFKQFNIPILKNHIITETSEIKDCISEIIKEGPPWIVKCQIRSGGRGKSGGVQIVNSMEDMLAFANRWFGKNLVTYQTTVDGERVNSILIEPAVNIAHEFYLSILIDRDLSNIICIVSTKGGVDIENVIHESVSTSDVIYKISIDPLIGACAYQGRLLASKLSLSGTQINQFTDMYINLVRMFIEKDLTLIEINPLIINKNNDLLCLDAKVSIDRNALFRQLDLVNLFLKNNNPNDNSHLPKLYSKYGGVNYVALDGNIGLLVNGAGLAMATMDLIKLFGGNPANFLDIGGDTNQESITEALKKLFKQESIKVIFINIFGGIVCCKLIADSIIHTLFDEHTELNIPIVVRLEGNNAKMGIDKLINANFKNVIIINNLINAVHKIMELVK